jgi:RimJ/RimL family protein N-acetyltransferase
MQNVPVLETKRLVMRGHTREDLGDAVALWTHPSVVQFIGGHALDEEQVWTRLLRYVGHWALLGFGYWVVREKSTQRFVGEVGFGDFLRVDLPELHGIPEAGWAIAPAAQGRGFATEAVTAAHHWLEHVHGAERSVCMIAPQNAPSLRVASKCGYQAYAEARYRGETALLLERMSPASREM